MSEHLFNKQPESWDFYQGKATIHVFCSRCYASARIDATAPMIEAAVQQATEALTKLPCKHADVRSIKKRWLLDFSENCGPVTYDTEEEAREVMRKELSEGSGVVLYVTEEKQESEPPNITLPTLLKKNLRKKP